MPRLRYFRFIAIHHDAFLHTHGSHIFLFLLTLHIFDFLWFAAMPLPHCCLLRFTCYALRDVAAYDAVIIFFFDAAFLIYSAFTPLLVFAFDRH